MNSGKYWIANKYLLLPNFVIMKKKAPKKRAKKYEPKLAVKGTFLDAFKVVKKNKEDKKKEGK